MTNVMSGAPATYLAAEAEARRRSFAPYAKAETALTPYLSAETEAAP